VIRWDGEAERPAEERERVWRALYTAEGSDWFWWYYSRNKFGQEQMFDQEFRLHLANVYRYMSLPTPPWLERPIWSEPPPRLRAPSGYVNPRLAADPIPAGDWAHAGYFDARRSSGAMQMGGGALGRVYFGYNPADLCVRIEAGDELAGYTVAVYVGVEGVGPANAWPRFADQGQPNQRSAAPLVWEIALPPQTLEGGQLGRARGGEEWDDAGPVTEALRKGGVAEISCPLAQLGLELGQTVSLFVALARERRIVETLPSVGEDHEYLTFTLAAHA
jgi:hypothetical protein